VATVRPNDEQSSLGRDFHKRLHSRSVPSPTSHVKGPRYCGTSKEDTEHTVRSPRRTTRFGRHDIPLTTDTRAAGVACLPLLAFMRAGRFAACVPVARRPLHEPVRQLCIDGASVLIAGQDESRCLGAFQVLRPQAQPGLPDEFRVAHDDVDLGVVLQ
jgi:hypothetical protein